MNCLQLPDLQVILWLVVEVEVEQDFLATLPWVGGGLHLLEVTLAFLQRKLFNNNDFRFLVR